MTSLDHLIEKVTEGNSPVDRIAALGELHAKGNHEEVFSTAEAALEDENLQVRSLALKILGSSIEKSPIEPLIEVSRWDPSPQIRMEALKLLATQQQERSRETLEQALEEADGEVRRFAQKFLNTLPTKSKTTSQ